MIAILAQDSTKDLCMSAMLHRWFDYTCAICQMQGSIANYPYTSIYRLLGLDFRVGLDEPDVAMSDLRFIIFIISVMRLLDRWILLESTNVVFRKGGAETWQCRIGSSR